MVHSSSDDPAGEVGTFNGIVSTSTVNADGAFAGVAGTHPGGGTMRTMLSHFGQAWISPITFSLRIFSRAWQVSQVTWNGSTENPHDLKIRARRPLLLLDSIIP
jgi:hypothetical protein